MSEDILNYFWLIKSIAKKFYNIEKEDLYQAGYLGLIKASKNYDGVKDFASFAYKYVLGEMYNLTLKSKDIKLNKYYLKLYKLIIKTRNYLMLENGVSPTNEDIANYLKVDVKDINDCEYLMKTSLSLDSELEHSFGYEINNDDRILINDSLNNLDTLSHQVMYYRYLMDLTQIEVAKILGISQVKVSRIEAKSKQKILEYIS